MPIATIKFYRREGLLPPGRHVSANQVEYETSHLHRLRLIRALAEVGGLTLPSVRALLDSPQAPSDVLAAATERPRRTSARDERWHSARDQVMRLLVVNGWRVRREAAGLDAVADVLFCLRDLEQGLPADILAGYVRLARATVGLAAHSLERPQDRPPQT
ncbi:MerR family transcriptional regulator [Nonomuraea guangzhouensis]|uniref:MerR family transcriptional regulator n=1 Tax=Nonomuraea guangzhouensis TaxID=1291555 RepID=A0ABW4GJ38_9ACTN|nr:MerR family transcriptional regulator [Nonomuraea guangzhouensis]